MSNHINFTGSVLHPEGTKYASKHHSPGFVILSFIVCFIGSWTRLELVHKKTAFHGWYNLVLLAGGSLSMGGMAVWAMEFIGNYAVVLGNGDHQHAAYSPGATILSALLPILFTGITFSFVFSEADFSYIRTGLGGLLGGLGFCASYFAGRINISNYNCNYDLPYVIGAILIAVITNTFGLATYSWSRSAWSADWYIRGFSSFVLAGAVSGQFWLVSSGTLYELKDDPKEPNSDMRTATVVSVVVISVIGCLAFLFVAVFRSTGLLQVKDRARQVVLATAVFDEDGKLMVNSDGVLPNCKITNSYHEQDANDIFDTSHSSFLWMLRTSHNWKSIKNIVPAMRKHLDISFEARSYFRNGQGTPVHNYHMTFRALFCTAAASLADDMHQPLEKLGVMFDDIVSTDQNAKQNRFMAEKRTSSVDLEKDTRELEPFGKGQLLFIIRQVDQREADRLRGAGYRFADTAQVIPGLGRTFRLRRSDLKDRFHDMFQYSMPSEVLDPGVHWGFFCVRARIGGSFEMATPISRRNLLPTMKLPNTILEGWQKEFLQNLEGETVATCLKIFHEVVTSETSSLKERLFATHLRTALAELRDEINDSFCLDARLLGAPIHAPCRGPEKDSPPSTATVYIFRIFAPLQNPAPGKKLRYAPIALFKAQQYTMPHDPAHAIFARRTYREFGSILDLQGRTGSDDIKTPPLHDANDTTPNFPETTGAPNLRYLKNLPIILGIGKHAPKAKRQTSLQMLRDDWKRLSNIMVVKEVMVDVISKDQLSRTNTAVEDFQILDLSDVSGGQAPGRMPRVNYMNETAQDKEAPDYIDDLLKLSVGLKA
ncbi:hypothetical protein BJ878DRAFT_73003 [Calycina marina]|uniref:MHYT domain-containing protein n=1 Tax=Calycina marina TaxID=1763456 RepID=A0A9P7Z2T1_9HELO|nr:hypothetical protein BJ878DRAFT_73003 [Calycina marina]